LLNLTDISETVEGHNGFAVVIFVSLSFLNRLLIRVLNQKLGVKYGIAAHYTKYKECSLQAIRILVHTLTKKEAMNKYQLMAQRDVLEMLDCQFAFVSYFYQLPVFTHSPGKESTIMCQRKTLIASCLTIQPIRRYLVRKCNQTIDLDECVCL